MSTHPIRVICVAGARPNFMKLAPLLSQLQRDPQFQPILVHTGQHYDDAMSGQFFRDLNIKAPDYNLEVGSGTHAVQTAEIMRRFEPVILEQHPHAVLVVGDVNSTVACALVAVKLGVPVIHVEAGLRSFDRAMPEEINRILTDAITDLFLITEDSGRVNLLHEGVPAEKIHLVGNLMIDSLRANLERAKASDVLERLALLGQNGRAQRYAVVTLHRPSNVDDAKQLAEIAGALEHISAEMPILFPVHPRTRARIGTAGLPGDIRLIDPLGYLDFLCLLASSSLVLTDSGGIQEETTVLGVPCLTLRENTERPATIENGTNILAGTSRLGILKAWNVSRQQVQEKRVPPFWDGSAAMRAHQVMRSYFKLT